MAMVPQTHQGGDRKGEAGQEDQDHLPEVWFEDSGENKRERDELPVEGQGDDASQSRWDLPPQLRGGHGDGMWLA